MILMLPLALEARVILRSVTSIGSAVPTWAISPSVNFKQVGSIKPKFLVTYAL